MGMDLQMKSNYSRKQSKGVEFWSILSSFHRINKRKTFVANTHFSSCFRWDLSLLEQMPDHMKICFLGLYNTVNEIAEEGRKTQGHDVLGYIRNLVCFKESLLVDGLFINYWVIHNI